MRANRSLLILLLLALGIGALVILRHSAHAPGAGQGVGPFEGPTAAPASGSDLRPSRERVGSETGSPLRVDSGTSSAGPAGREMEVRSSSDEAKTDQRRAFSPMTRGELRETLMRAIEGSLPDWSPTEEELDGLADATFRLREAQAELREVPLGAFDGARRRALRRAVETAIVDFTAIAGMSPAEWSERIAPPDAPPRVGEDSAGAEAILIRPIEAARP